MNSTEKGNIGEDLVNRIAYDSFFEHWCYPSPKDEKGDKKEICDLLILFGDKLVIISVKNYDFKGFYSRYFRRTIDKAVKQIYGAERKLFNSKNDIFIKHPKRDIEKFPRDNIKAIHRVIVNLGEGVQFYPFNKETKDEKFITILDKDAFQSIVHELDTIPDFLEYLRKREELFNDKIATILPGEEDDFSPETTKQFFEHSQNNFNSSKNILISGTEHDLLANYLKNKRTFPEYIHSGEYNGFIMQIDGIWEEFNQRSQVQEKRKLDKISYFLDELVKREVLNNIDKSSIEVATAIMSFNRFNRRIISDKFFQFYEANKDSNGNHLARQYADFEGTGIVFAFYHKEMAKEMVNTLLSIALDSFCLYSNYKSNSMILIATTNEFEQFKIGLLKDIKPFSKEEELEIRRNVELLRWFTNHREIKFSEKEYPDSK